MIDASRLLQQLNNTGVQNKDTPLYQFLKELIRVLIDISNSSNASSSGGGSTSIINQLLAAFPDLVGQDGQDGMSVIGPAGPKGLDGIPIGLLFNDSDGYDNDVPSFPFVLGPFTKGSILFQGDGKVTENNSKLFWDNTNNRLGIGNNAPTATLYLVGSGANTDVIMDLSTANAAMLRYIASGSGLLSLESVGDVYVNSDSDNNATGRTIFFGTDGQGSAATVLARLLDTGSFGVGVSPTARLHVESSIGTALVKFVNTHATGPGLDIVVIASSTEDALLVRGNNGSTIVLEGLANGKVGIGKVANASYICDIGGATNIDGNLTYDTAAVFSWNAKSVDTVYQAASDGIVTAMAEPGASGQGTIEIRTDSSNPPTTVRQKQHYFNTPIEASISCPVKKGDYYKVVTTTAAGSPTFTVYWVPLGLNG